MKYFFSIYLSLLSFFIFTLNVHSQITLDDFTDLQGKDGGQAVAMFLNLPAGAEALSTNPVSAMGVMDATGLPFTTANSALFRRYRFSLSHLEWIMGLRKEYAAACFPILDIGTAGIFSQVFTLGRFDYARDIDEDISEPRAAEVNVGATFARSFFKNRFMAGISLSYLESRLCGESGRAFNTGYDFLLQPLPWVSGRLYARNIGTPVTYNYTKEPLPMQTGAGVKFTAPVKDTSKIRNTVFQGGIGVAKTINSPLTIGIGTDLTFLDRYSLRAGYEYKYKQNPSAEGISAGIGLSIKNYSVDAGWKYQSSDFGSVWAVTAEYNTEELTPRTAKDYYEIAQKHFRKERYHLCINNCSKAISINPNLWQAHSLINRAKEVLRRKAGFELALIYTGNTKGKFAHFITDSVMAGGLARRVTVIKNIRKQYQYYITVEGGNFLTGFSHKLKGDFLEKYFKYTDTDVSGLGPGEISFGIDNLKPGIDFILSNYNGEAFDNFISYRIIKKGDYSFALMNVIETPLQINNSTYSGFSPVVDRINSITDNKDIRNASLRILIAHGSWDAIQSYASKLSSIDIIICASVKQEFHRPMQSGSTVILSAGEMGRHVGCLSLIFNSATGSLSSLNNRLIPVTEEIVPNPEMNIELLKMISQAELDKDEIDPQSFSAGDSSGIFPFISDRKGYRNVYLKIIDKHLEFPYDTLSKPVLSPKVSFVTGKVFYLHKDTDKLTTLLKSVNISGSGNMVLPLDGSVKDFCFSRSHKWIYASVQAPDKNTFDMYRIKPSGTIIAPLLKWENSTEKNLSVSPDGKNILFTSDKNGRIQVFMTDTSGHTTTIITDTKADCSDPAFSPDGRYIAYLSDRYNFRGKKDIWIYEPFSGNRYRITRNTDVKSFIWKPDSREIIYSAGSNIYELFRRDIFGSHSKRLIDNSSIKNYSEVSPALITYKDKTKIIYTREYENGEKRIYMVNPEGNSDQCIVNSRGSDWLE